MASCAAILAASTSATAAPQLNLSLTAGPALTDVRDGAGVALHLGGRGAAHFFRSREHDMGLGPYVDIATAAFDTLELGGGAEWVVPTGGEFAFVFSGGAHARKAPTVGNQPGVSSTIFFGSRSYNFHSVYALAGGLFVQGRYGLGDSRQADVIFGAQVDVAALALPIIYLINAFR